jgi:short-subunit dehydrogenase
MKHVVITGSSAGIGFGIAKEFLEAGYAITISSSNPEKLNRAYVELLNVYSKERINYCVCDVRSTEQILNLWESGHTAFGRIDIWVNNAGMGQDFALIRDLDEKTVSGIIDLNVKGMIHACIKVYNKMSEQGFGAIYNMEGFGSDGRKMPKLGVYGTSKAALTYFTDSFIKETKGGAVIVGKISPGMVITDMLMQPVFKDPKDAKRFLTVTNILGDRVQTVTPWLVSKMINNSRHGRSFRWLTNLKATARFMTAPFRKNRLIREADLKLELRS